MRPTIEISYSTPNQNAQMQGYKPNETNYKLCHITEKQEKLKKNYNSIKSFKKYKILLMINKQFV